MLTIDNAYMQEVLEIDNINRKNGRESWTKTIEYLLKTVNINISDLENNKLNLNKKKINEDFEKGIKKTFLDHWRINLENKFNNRKLEFYTEYKRNFSFEPYLDNLNHHHKKNVAKLRLSNHKFPIEKLRYNNIERKNRLCKMCPSNSIGDENHYMFYCKHDKLKNSREEFLVKLADISRSFLDFDELNAIKYALTMADKNILQHSADFICRVMVIFNEHEENSINDRYIELLM